MIKRTIFSSLFSIVLVIQLFACPVCERNQPDVFWGGIHGSSPSGNLDYIIVGVIAVISLLTLFFAIKWLINPGERAGNHIKRTILKVEDYE